QEILIFAHDRLVGGVAQQGARVELFAGQIAEIAVGLALEGIWIGQHGVAYLSRPGEVRRPMPDIDCQAPSSNTSMPAPSSNAVQPIATSVTVPPLLRPNGRGALPIWALAA